MDIWQANPRFRLAVLVAAWASYSASSGQYVLEDAAGRRGNEIVFTDALHRTVRGLRSPERSVWLIGPTPGAPAEASFRMAMARLNRGNETQPVSLAAFELPKSAFDEAISSLARDDRVFLSDPGTSLCDSMSCKYEVDGMPLYRDGGHLNTHGAQYLQPFLDYSFRQVMPRTDCCRQGGSTSSGRTSPTVEEHIVSLVEIRSGGTGVKANFGFAAPD